MTDEKKPIRIPDLFGSMMQGDSERLQIAKELFTAENIDMKTEMTAQEINLFSRAAFIRDTFSLDSLNIFMDQFMRLRVSMARKGRGEFVDCVKNQPKEDALGGLASMFKSGKI